MKKFARISLITAGILFITGVVILIICSIFAGGRLRGALSDTVSSELHSTLNGDILELFDIGTHHHDFNNSFPVHSGQHTDNNAAADSDITELYLELGAVDFTLAPSQDDYFHITSDGKGEYQYYTDGSAFYIDGFYNHRSANINKLTLEIPDKEFTHVSIELGAGTANLSAIKSDTVDIEIGAGELVSSGITCDDIEAEIGAGSALIKNGITNNANFDIGMGELTYKGNINADLSVDVGMGSITLQLADSQDNHNYLLEADMGSIALGQRQYGGMAFETELDNNADSTYSLTCAMGSISVSFQDTE